MTSRLFVFVSLCAVILVVQADVSDDQKCPCSKPPRADLLNIHRTVNTDVDKCPCSHVKPRTDIQELAKCPCGVKPRSDEEAKCPCSQVKPRSDEKTAEKCPCGVKPRSDEEAKCPCSQVKPRSDVQELAKCPCSKPPHREIIARVCACIAGAQKPLRLEEFVEKCPCAGKPKPNKELSEGAEVFIAGAHAITEVVTGGIVAQNTGNLKDGLPYIFEGINALVQLASRSEHPEQVYNQIYRFMASLDQQEMAQLLASARAIKTA